MKSLNKWLLISIIGLGVFSREVYSNSMSLDERIHAETTKHMSTIDNLTMANLLTNKAKIEALCKALLKILNEQHFKSSKAALRKALEANSITHLKLIIQELPETTKAVVIAKIKDERIKQFLGL